MAAANTEKPATTVDMKTPAETFKALSVEYEFCTSFVDKLVELKFTSLLDFKHAFASEAEIVANFCSLCGADGKLLVQQSRIRRAWWGVAAALAAKAGRATLGEGFEDLDQPLSSTELEHLDHAFNSRYKTYYPPGRSPADVVTSRSSREMSKRKLTLRDLAGIKTVAQLQHCQKKRRRIAEDIYHEEVETEHTQNMDTVSGYLANLLTYLLSLAKAGTRPVEPLPSTPEGHSTDSTLYVQCPLDILMRYYWRAILVSEALPPQQALNVIRRQDVQERTEWVDRFRNSVLPLGQIVKAVYESRSAHWDVSNLLETNVKQSGGRLEQSKTKNQAAPAAGTSAKELRDGTKLCADFNSQAGCREKNCERYHRCSFVKGSGRVCGSYGHGFCRHKET